MARVVITKSLFLKIKRTFNKSVALEILNHLESLRTRPKKGKLLGAVGGIVIKELKYKNYRFYFITDGFVLKFGNEEELAALLIKFVRLSEKKNQQKIINEIKKILKSMGFDSF